MRQLIFAPRRPDATLGPDLFALREAPMPTVEDGHVLIRILVISVDPAQVGWLMSATRYAPKVDVGDVMRAWCAGDVVESRHPRFFVSAIACGARWVVRTTRSPTARGSFP